ncbi:MAG: hypothetical protein U1F11_05145 [Steroidobacteraceae bacterium]
MSLDGHNPARLYDLVMREVEEPLFRAVLDYADGNQRRRGHTRHQPRHAAQEAAGVRAVRLSAAAHHRFGESRDDRDRTSRPAVRFRQDGPARPRPRARGAQHRDPSTGGTARLLATHGIAVKEVSAHTGFPEIMDGRVKTLHSEDPRRPARPARRGRERHGAARHRADRPAGRPYPFAETVASLRCTYEEAVENIDIGGPATVRAAAKNHESVAAWSWIRSTIRRCSPSSRPAAAPPLELRARLAAKAYAHTARYDSMVSSYLPRPASDPGRALLGLAAAGLREGAGPSHGENPHQQAAFYRDAAVRGPRVAKARMFQGKELSFNNIADADTAIECVRQFEAPACVIVKHANPCGVAVAADALAAYERAYRTDPTSAFGGIIAFNRAVDGATARAMVGRQIEVLAALPLRDEARSVLRRQGQRARARARGRSRARAAPSWSTAR